MGWWDSLWASSKSADDPLRKLDPELRKFLQKESPIKYDQQAHSSQQADPERIPTIPSEKSTNVERIQGADREASVPKESLYQDGRYSHLWKTYRPLAEIEAETKNDHEKLMDVLEGFKERKAQIGKAALENCALEQVDWRTCMSSPTFSERMTLCRDQVRKFEKCYMTQTRLLKALGYLSTYDRSPEVEEDIQMHADALYHRLVSQEAEIEAAKREGRPIPKFPPLVPKQPVVGKLQQRRQEAEEELTPVQLEQLKKRLDKVNEVDRAAEEAAFRAEMRVKSEVAERVQDLWKQQELDRQTRKERGEETMWDKLTGTFRSNSGDSNSQK